MLSTTVREAVIAAVNVAVTRTLEDVSAGLVEDEPTFSARLATRIQDGLRALVLDGVTISAHIRNLADRGTGAAEAVYGADLLVVLRVDTDDDTVNKGALIQAKGNTGREGVRVTGEQRHRLQVTTLTERFRTQCDRMLAFTPASFVWVYHDMGVRSATAASVTEGSPGRSRTTVASTDIADFVDGLLACTIGDRRLNAADNRTLDQLLVDAGARTGLVVEIMGPDGATEFVDPPAPREEARRPDAADEDLIAARLKPDPEPPPKGP